MYSATVKRDISMMKVVTLRTFCKDEVECQEARTWLT